MRSLELRLSEEQSDEQITLEEIPTSLKYGTEYMRIVQAGLGRIAGQLALNLHPVAESAEM